VLAYRLGRHRVRRLRALRLARGWTQGDLALNAGVQPSSVSASENGLTAPGVLLRLAEVLGVDDPESLLEFVEPEDPRS
jgi:transcriptional regulator with XRE-family HTH domain